MSRYRLFIFFLFSTVLSTPLTAKIIPDRIFQDGMVLQRDVPFKIWGSADAGEKLVVQIGDQKKEIAARDDGKWEVVLDPIAAGGPFELNISGENQIVLKDILFGDVWLCFGQSNMLWRARQDPTWKTESAKANNKNIRLYKGGAWMPCTPANVESFSGVGYFFGKEIQEHTQVPIGIIQAAVSGSLIQAWLGREYYESTPFFKKNEELPIITAEDRGISEAEEADGGTNPNKKKKTGTKPDNPLFHAKKIPSGLHEQLIKSIRNLQIKGAVWYQGETNGIFNQGDQYRVWMPLLIKNLRSDFRNEKLPFIVVQLPNWIPFEKAPRCDWPKVREAQLEASSLSNAWTVITIDIGEANKLHPNNKRDVGIRASLIARNMVYGEKIVSSGPRFKSMEVKGGKAELSFETFSAGLQAGKDGKETLKEFFIAGENKQFLPADAVIENDRIIVSSINVPNPVATRYGWSNNPECNLYNNAGLPASPFRTDKWDEVGPLDGRKVK